MGLEIEAACRNVWRVMVLAGDHELYDRPCAAVGNETIRETLDRLGYLESVREEMRRDDPDEHDEPGSLLNALGWTPREMCPAAMRRVIDAFDVYVSIVHATTERRVAVCDLVECLRVMVQG